MPRREVQSRLMPSAEPARSPLRSPIAARPPMCIGRHLIELCVRRHGWVVLGKPLGIVLFSWASVRLGMTRLPDGLNWKVIVGAGCLGGIGFTMSLFVAGLAFDQDLLDEGKIGILAGSAISAILGCLLLWLFLPGASRSSRWIHLR